MKGILALNKIVHSGKQTLFWHNRWTGHCTLKCAYPNLFLITSYPDISVVEVYILQ